MTEIVCVDEIWFNDVESMTVMGARLADGGRWGEDRVNEDPDPDHDGGYAEENDGDDKSHNAPFD